MSSRKKHKHEQEQEQSTQNQDKHEAAVVAQAFALMCRIYVGGISFKVSQESVSKIFSCFGPLKNINMPLQDGQHKGFAFLEYDRVPEAALAAIQYMDGKTIGGRQLKVGRPVANVEAAAKVVEKIIAESNQCHRLYIASVHPELTKDDIQGIFEPFGVIKEIQLPKKPSGVGHRGFCFIEFTTEEAVKNAVESMNGYVLGGQCLQIVRCITSPKVLMKFNLDK